YDGVQLVAGVHVAEEQPARGDGGGGQIAIGLRVSGSQELLVAEAASRLDASGVDGAGIPTVRPGGVLYASEHVAVAGSESHSHPLAGARGDWQEPRAKEVGPGHADEHENGVGAVLAAHSQIVAVMREARQVEAAGLVGHAVP